MDNKIEQLLRVLVVENPPRYESHGFDRTRETHQRFMQNLRTCVLSAQTFVSATASSIGSRSSVIDGSEFGDDLSDSKRKNIQDWIVPPVIPEGDPNEESSIHGVEVDDTDGGVEFHVIQNWRRMAADKIKSAEFKETEALLHEIVTKSEEVYGKEYEWKDETVEMLATVYCRQQKWDEAEEFLLRILKEREADDEKAQVSDIMHFLGEVYFAKNDLVNAEQCSLKAVKGKEQRLGPRDPSFHRSVALLVQIYEEKGEEIHAQGYRSFLPSNYFAKDRQEIEQLFSLSSGIAATMIGTEFLMDLLPEDSSWKWDEIRENIRMRKKGISGSGYGYTLIHALAENGHDSALQLLLEHEPDADVKDNDGNTPLHLAAAGQESTMQRLIEKGADVNSRTNDGKTALIIAAENGKANIVHMLVERGANVNAKDDFDWTALHYAAFSGAEKVARLLLENGVDVSIKGASERTPLHCAASRGHEGVVRVLLERGADVNTKSRENLTALDLAQKYHRESVVRLLRPSVPTPAPTRRKWGFIKD